MKKEMNEHECLVGLTGQHCGERVLVLVVFEVLADKLVDEQVLP